MPMAFAFAIWICIATIGQDYLWVAERGKLVAAAVAVGLMTNVLLNLFLLPLWGLHGAVFATLIANGIFLLALWMMMARHGYELDRTTFYVTILPATLLAGPWAALVCVVVVCVVDADAVAWCREGIDILLAKLTRRTDTAARI
jgi:O-antigen/teichoic acid export membrane protein